METTYIKTIKEQIEAVNNKGRNHNHNTLVYEFINDPYFIEKWNVLMNNTSNYFHNEYDCQDSFYGKVKEELMSIEQNLIDKKIDLNATIDLILDLGVKHISKYDLPNNSVFRFGINRTFKNNELEDQLIYNQEWVCQSNEALRLIGINLGLVWTCVENGLYHKGIDLVNFCLSLLNNEKLIEDKAFDHVNRRKMSCYMVKGALHLMNNEKDKAYKCFEEISTYFTPSSLHSEQTNHNGLYWRVGATRSVEAAIEMFKLKPNKTNKELCIDLYLKTLLPYYEEGQNSDKWESVRERVLITYMLKKHVL